MLGLTASVSGTRRPAKAIPVIQIHGAGFGHFNFATATPILSQSFRCIDFDMRGYGQSERPFQQYDMEVWADDVAGLMDHLGLRTAHIHGTSMGGMVAQQFAAKYPERTHRLVINCSTAKLDYAGVLTFRGWIDIAERCLVHALCALSRAHEAAPRAAPNLARALDRAAADFYLANSFWLAAPVAAASDLWGRLRHHLVSTARHWRVVAPLGIHR